MKELQTFFTVVVSRMFKFLVLACFNVMIEASKAQSRTDEDERNEIYVPPPQGKYLPEFILGTIFVIIIWCFLSNRSEVKPQKEKSQLENRIPFSGKGNKEN